MTDLAQLELRIRSLEVVTATQNLDRFSASGKRAEASARGVGAGFASGSRGIDRMSESLFRVGRQVSLVAAAFYALNLARGTIKVLADIETGLVGIAKTTNASTAQLRELQKEFSRMATNVSTPIEKLLMLGQVAGQLGVRGVQNISNFASTIAKLAQAAPSIQGEEAALSLARLLNITGEGSDQIDELASVIVRLGNEVAATEAEIVHAATFIGQATASFKLSSAEIVALGASVKEVGLRAELAGTAVGRGFSKIDQAVKDGGTALEQFAKVAGVSTEEFKAAFERGPTESFTLFVKGLGDVLRSGANVSVVLRALGIDGEEAIRAFSSLGARSYLVAENFRRVADETKKNTALEKEFARGSDTLNSAWERLRNTGKVLLDEVLNRNTGLAGQLRAFVDIGKESLIVLTGIDTQGQKASSSAQALASAVQILGVTLAAFGAYLAAGGLLTLGKTIGSAVPSFALLAGALSSLTLGITDFGTAVTIVVGIMTTLKLSKLTSEASQTALAFIKLGEAGRQAVLSGTASALNPNLRKLTQGAASAASAKLEAEAVRDLAAARVLETKATLESINKRNASTLVVREGSAGAIAFARANVEMASSSVQAAGAELETARALRARAREHVAAMEQTIAQTQASRVANQAAIASAEAAGASQHKLTVLRKEGLVIDRVLYAQTLERTARLPALVAAEQAVAAAQKRYTQTTETLGRARARLDVVSKAGVVQEQVRAAALGQVAALERQLIVEEEALQKANLVLGTTTKQAAAATTIFGRSLLFVKGAFAQLFASLAANPFGALLLGLSIVVPLFVSFSNEADEATEAVKRLKKANEDLRGPIQALAEARAAEELARRQGDVPAEVAAMNQRIAAYRDFQKEVIKIQQDKNASPAIPVESLLEVPELELEGEALKNSIRDQLAAALEAGLRESFRGIEDSSAFDIGKALSVLFKGEKVELGPPTRFGIQELLEGVKKSFDGLGFKAGDVLDLEGIEVDQKRLSRISDLLNDLNRNKFDQGSGTFRAPQAIKELREELTSFFDTLVNAIPNDTVFDVLRKKAEEAQKMVEALNAATSQGKAPFTEEQVKAQDELRDLEKRLALEARLAGLTERQAGLQRQLAEATNLLDTSGLDADEVKKKREIIEALLQEIDARTRARDALKKEREARAEASKELADYLLQTTRETELMALSTKERERAEAVDKALLLTRKAGLAIGASVFSIVMQEITAQQRLKKATEEREKAEKDAAAAAKKRSEERLRYLEETITLVERTTQAVEDQFRRVDQNTKKERAAFFDIEEVAEVRNAIEEFGITLEESRDALRQNRDAALALSDSFGESVAIAARYSLALDGLSAKSRQFAVNLLNLKTIEVFTSLRQEAEDVDRAFDSFFRTDRDNRLEQAMVGVREQAELLKALAQERFNLKLIDEAELARSNAAIADFVDAAKAKFEDLEDLARIREAAQDLANAFGDAFGSVLTGASSVEEATLRLVDTIRSALVERIVVQPFVEQLTASLTSMGATLFGAGQTLALQTSLTTAATTASTLLIGGGNAAGAALVASASAAAGILSGAGVGTGAAAGLGGIFARGGLLSGGRVQAFAQGGTLDRGVSATIAAMGRVPSFGAGAVVNGPTLRGNALIGEGARSEGVFPLDKTSSGRQGVMASMEGPDGRAMRTVLELARLADGNLGVKVPRDPQKIRAMARGGTMDAGFGRFQASSLDGGPVYFGGGSQGGGGSRVVNVTMNQTIKTPDVAGFRASSKQRARDSQRDLRRLGRNA